MIPLFLAGIFGAFFIRRKSAAGSASTGSNATQIMPLDSHVQTFSAIEQDILARTIWGEARNSGYSGMQAVANVIINRARANKRMWGGSVVSNVCRYPYQFSCWNLRDPNRAKLIAVTASDAAFKTCLQIAAKALSGTLPDLTKGSTYYLTSVAYREDQAQGYKTASAWSYGETPIKKIGTHYFFTERQVNGVA